MWSKNVSTGLGGQRWNSEGIGPQSCSQRSRMVILLLAQHYLLHTSQLHMATSTLNISDWTWALGQVCGSQGDHSFVLPDSQILRLKTMRLDACVTFLPLKVTLQRIAKNTFQNSFCQVSLSLSWLFSTALRRVCSRWTLDRQSKSRRDNSSRWASYLPALLALLPALVLHPLGRSLSNKRRKPPRLFAIRRLLQWRLSDNRFLDADSVSEKRQQNQLKSNEGETFRIPIDKKLLKMQHY